MISDTFRNEDWYKLIESKYKKTAQKLNEAHLHMNDELHNAGNSMRNIVEDIMDIIGKKEKQKILLKANESKGIKYNTLESKTEALRKLNLIDKKLYDTLTRLRPELNSLVHDSEDFSPDYVHRMFLDVVIFIKYFVNKYENLEEFTKEYKNDAQKDNESDNDIKENSNFKKIKYCSNKKQCGRRYEEYYTYNFCIKCAAPIDEIEEIIEVDEKNVVNNKQADILEEAKDSVAESNKVEFSHYLFVGELIINDNDELEAMAKKKIKLDEKDIVLGRTSPSSDYIPNIDFCKYVEEERKVKQISKKHASIYKKDGKYYIKNISNGNHVFYDFVGDDGNTYQEYLDSNESVELTNGMFVAISDVAFVEYMYSHS